MDSPQHKDSVNRHYRIYSKLGIDFEEIRKFSEKEQNGLITIERDNEDVLVKINKKLLKRDTDNDVVLIIDKKNYTLRLEDMPPETSCDSVEKLLKKKRARSGKLTK